MKTVIRILFAALLASVCSRARAEDADTTDTAISGSRQQQVFHDVGPRRSVLVGVEVYFGRFFNNDVVHGIRPIFLDAQGREQLGSIHGKDTGRPPIRVKAKKGYAIGAISVKSGLGVDGLLVTYMKLDKGKLDPDQSYDSEWLGGQGGGGARRLGGSGDPVVGIFGSENNNSELCGIGLVQSSAPIAATAQKKVAPPDDAAQAKATKLAKEVYGDDWKAAKTLTQKQDFARKLIQGADESDNDPAARYVLLRLARDIATQAGSGLIAFEAIDKMAEHFVVDDVDMKGDVLTSFSKKAKTPQDHKSICDQAVGLIDGAIAQDKIELAVKVCELAMPEARASRDADLLAEVKSRREKCHVLNEAYRTIKDALAVLEKQPDDPAANLTVGKYYCFQSGNWEKGLPMLALGADKSLAAQAAQEIAGITESAPQLKAGDTWWDLGEKETGRVQTNLRARAVYWYQQALPQLSGLSKVKVEKRIKEVESAGEGGGEEGPAVAKHSPSSSSKFLPGLAAQYYSDPAFTVRATARVDDNLNFDWNFDAPVPQVNAQNYSVRWFGYLKVTKAGRYTIHARGHNDCQVSIDNKMVIANPVLGHNASNQTGDVTLTAGYHLLVAQFVHEYGSASMHIGWQPPGAPTWSAVPAENLFHDAKQEQAVGLGRR